MRFLPVFAAGLACLMAAQPAAAIDGNDPGSWVEEWPDTDFDPSEWFLEHFLQDPALRNLMPRGGG